jgi:pimeloyl-ACP methyl ester carboxylesterase
MAIAVPAPVRTGQVDLPDGRTLGWSEWGHEAGTPVLLCPGAGTSRRLGFGADALEDLGIRLVSADRPGLGASDPAPGRTLLDWADDVAELAQAIGLGRPAVVGYSQGAPFALACAASGVASSVAVVAGTDELAHPAFADTLAPELRHLIDTARSEPEAAEREFARMDAGTLCTMVIDMSAEADRVIYAEPEFARAYRDALDEGFRHGSGGYARDTVLAMAPWPFDVADIAVPVDLWYGGQDTSPVHSPDFGATLAQRVPGARRHLERDAGGAILWTHAAPILRAIVSARP